MIGSKLGRSETLSGIIGAVSDADATACGGREASPAEAAGRGAAALRQRLRLSPDYSSIGIWPDGPQPDGALPWSTVQATLPDSLIAELRAWVKDWESWHDCDHLDDEHVGWIRQGRSIHARLAKEMAELGICLRADFEGRRPHGRTGSGREHL